MRRWASLWTAAEGALAAAWAAAAIGLLAYALARGSVGSGAIAAFATWQLSHIWHAVHARAARAPGERKALRPPR